MVKDYQEVSKDQYLAIIENPASWKDMISLGKQAQVFKASLGTPATPLPSLHFTENLVLGELHPYYVDFLKALREYALFQKLNFYERQMQAIRQRIGQYARLNTQLIKQNKLIAEELGLSEKRFQADSILRMQDVIAEFEVHTTKRAHLQTRQSYERNWAETIQNDIEASQLKARLTELELEKMEKENKLRNMVEDAFKNLESQRTIWEQRYVLKAPIAGKITFSRYWSNHHYANINDEVLTIVPESSSLFGQVLLPVTGSGKVATGQRVNIRIDNFPYYEYGFLNGKVETISLVPKDNVYTIKISLPEGLHTSYKKELEFKQEMQGSAEIITKDLRIIERIFNTFRAFSDRNH